MSANAFNMDQSENLSFGKGLIHKFPYEINTKQVHS